ELGLGTHMDRTLQAEWNAVGPESFSMDVIELVRQREDAAFDYDGELRLLEQLYRLELEEQIGHR
ncbi:MAG TPA: GIY-YIG nuclease family protein, partial [Quisquiliibacterium sp.]|nr:GIY-YIG nuclease family protein [Quisquiliibacterium sp.]